METHLGFNYPKAPKGNIVDDFHGTKVADPYRWMEDPNHADLIDWVEKQNAIVNGYVNMDTLERFKKRLTQLYDYRRYGLPVVRGNKYFYTKNEGLQPQPIYYVREGIADDEQLLFDPNTLSEDGTTAVTEANYSHDGKYIAFSVSVHGSDWMEIRVFDIDKKEFLADVIENIRNGAGTQWLQDSSGFYYSAYIAKEESGTRKLWFHTLGDEQKADPLIFEHPTDDQMWVFAEIDPDEKYIFLIMNKSTMPRNLLYFKRMDSEGDFIPIVDELKYQYTVLTVHNDLALVRTNENADNSKVIAIDLNNYGKAHWKEFIPETDQPMENAWMGGSFVTNNHIVITYLDDVKHVPKVFDFDGNFIRDIELPTFGTIFASGEKKQKETFIMFTSFVYPTTVYNYNIERNEMSQFVEPSLDIDPTKYDIKQVFYSSKDGTKIPMYIMHNNGIQLDGSNPTILYGYGGFNISLTPGLSQNAILWMEEGGVFAIPNLRGGGEYGEKWHQSGMLEKKQNVFDDFIAAAEWLITNKYTSTPKLAIFGGSNGGLLTAACMLQRPDLYGAVVTAVGVLDMLRSHTYTIGRYWTPEYGNPENPEHFEFLIKYSPLHNIKEIAYPPTFIYTADTDDRVDPAHSKKYAAELQDKGKGGPLLLRVIVKAGHGMGKPITKMIEDAAYMFAFLDRTIAKN